MYTITLANGYVIDNVLLNGNNYISDTIIPDTVFNNNLTTVTISNGETNNTYTDMILVSNRAEGGKSWFILRELTESEKGKEAINKKLENLGTYIADLESALADVMYGG